jgi:POTRA domain, FtsQ-type
VSAASAAAARRSDVASPSAESWAPARSRIVLRKPKGNRRLASARRLPPVHECLDACGRALRRCAPVLVGLAMISAFGAAAALSHNWITTSQRFAIGAIDIRGTRVIDAAEAKALLPVHLGDNMFAADTRTLERALAAHPWVARVEVHRELPRTLVATITERTAAAVVDLGALYLVDPAGKPFKRVSLEPSDADELASAEADAEALAADQAAAASPASPTAEAAAVPAPLTAALAAASSSEAANLPVITGIERLAFRADPVATTRLIRSGLAAIEMWRSGGGADHGRAQADRPAVAEIRFDAHRGLTLRTAEPAVAVFLGALDDPSLAERMALFDAAWSHLSPDERARTETMYLDAGLGQATIAFAKN